MNRATSAAAYQTGQAGYAVTPAATAATYTQRPAAAAATGYETYQAAAAAAATGTTYAGNIIFSLLLIRIFYVVLLNVNVNECAWFCSSC